MNHGSSEKKSLYQVQHEGMQPRTRRGCRWFAGAVSLRNSNSTHDQSRDDVIERTATATAKKKMIIRRRLGSGTATKHLYVPLDVASTFISHFQPVQNAEITIRGGESEHAVEEQEREASGVIGDAGDVASASAFAAAGLGAAASDASRVTLTFLMAVPKPASLESGSACSERVTKTHEVEYERRQFEGEVHRRLTKGWHGLCLKLGARLGDAQEMSSYHC